MPRAQIQVELPLAMPDICADSDRLIQILRNLIENALVHTPADGTVTISSEIEGGMARVKVTDTGVGIAPEHLDLVFERFYRVDPSRTRSTGGSGVGLAITRQLVQSHGGCIGVTSEVGKGTCFAFTIPYVTRDE
jgi:signal transduction histidine kinase